MNPTHNDPFLVFDPNDDVSVESVRRRVDKYFTRKRESFAGQPATRGLWAVYLRGPSVAAFRRSTGFMTRVLNALGSEVTITNREGAQKTYAPTATANGLSGVQIFLPFKEGELVRGGGQPMFYYYGPSMLLDELETGELQRLGYASISALNAREMCRVMPDKSFIVMAARHFPDHNAVAYGVAVGSEAAKREFGAKGFTNTSTDEAAHWFGQAEGSGSMSHSFIAQAGSTLEAAKRYNAKHPDKPLIVLCDYFGREVSDSLEVARHFNNKAKDSTLSFRLDTHGDRYLEGLDIDRSHDIIEANAPQMLARKLSPLERKWLFEKGVSVASIFHFRAELDKAGFKDVKIVASSGFSAEKCELFAEAGAPIDTIGTGSHVSKDAEETFAKAEILGYEGQWQTKAGREWVLGRFERDKAKFGWNI